MADKSAKVRAASPLDSQGVQGRAGICAGPRARWRLQVGDSLRDTSAAVAVRYSESPDPVSSGGG